VPPEIQELLDEGLEIDPGTAGLIRAAIMSREPRRLRHAWQLLAARAELAQAMRVSGTGITDEPASVEAPPVIKILAGIIKQPRPPGRKWGPWTRSWRLHRTRWCCCRWP
jgi:hypothetical protein